MDSTLESNFSNAFTFEYILLCSDKSLVIERGLFSLFSAAYRENYALEWPMRKGRRSREMCSNERVEAYCC